MKGTFRKHGSTAIIAAVVAALVAGGPVVARTIADYAENSDKVDGRHAVGAHADRIERTRSLVATDWRGFLPNGIVRQVPKAMNASRLQGLGSTAFVRGCRPGAVRGQAYVEADVDDEFEAVRGFGTTYGGPLTRQGSNCHVGRASARRVSVGTYDVRLALVAWDCNEPVPPGMLTAVVSPVSSDPLIATYEPFCASNNVFVRVRISDPAGAGQDAPFSVALLDHRGIPIP